MELRNGTNAPKISLGDRYLWVTDDRPHARGRNERALKARCHLSSGTRSSGLCCECSTQASRRSRRNTARRKPSGRGEVGFRSPGGERSEQRGSARAPRPRRSQRPGNRTRVQVLRKRSERRASRCQGDSPQLMALPLRVPRIPGSPPQSWRYVGDDAIGSDNLS